MNKKALLLVCLFVLPALAAPDQQWILTQSTLTYSVSHPLHHVEGISHAARGKGVCHAGQCDFLIAVPVKTFDSGDSNRDIHTVQVTRAGEFPMVEVRTRLPETDANSSSLRADLQIQFAGQTAEFHQIEFQLTREGNDIHLAGTIPCKLTDFKIEPPTLLSMPIKNDIPVKVDMTWRPQ